MRLKYAVVYERAPGNYSAYVPDLPGRVAAGETASRNIRESIVFHPEGMREEKLPIPEPSSWPSKAKGVWQSPTPTPSMIWNDA